MSDPTEQAESPIKSAIKLLRSEGFLVARVPKCTKAPNHGRHVLVTKSVSCEGVGEIPHGYHSAYLGSFGTRVNCQCGSSFSDSAFEDADSPWGEHKKEHHVA